MQVSCLSVADLWDFWLKICFLSCEIYFIAVSSSEGLSYELSCISFLLTH